MYVLGVLNRSLMAWHVNREDQDPKSHDAWEMIRRLPLWGLIGNFSGGKLAIKLQVGRH